MVRSNFGAVRLPLLGAAVLASFAVSISAQVVERGRTFADLTASHPCDTGLTDRIARVTDCDAAGTIGDGGGAFQCWAYCDGSAPWADVAIDGGGGGAATAVEGSATLPATCTEKDLYQDTDSGGTEFYVCTATNTWTKTIAATDNVATATALAANGANCSAGSYPLGVTAAGAVESCTVAALGDVVGPSSATDNALVRFDATTGKLVQSSNLTCSDVSGVTTTLATITPAATTGATVAGQSLAITASPAVASTNTAGAAAGGSVTITAGAAARNTSGNANGGDINLVGGAGIGTGTAGTVTIPAGSESVPSLKFSSDLDTGIYSVGLDGSIGFVTNGVTNAFFNTSGLRTNNAKYLNGFSVLIEANTAGSGAPNVLLSNELATVLTNEGATAENYHTLPTAVAGYVFTFVVQDADGIRITAAAGDTIRPIAGTAASATGGFIRCATQGAFITLVAINATEWVAIGSAGVWTIDV